MAGYDNSTIGHPAHAGAAPCPPLHAQRKHIRIRMRAGGQEGAELKLYVRQAFRKYLECGIFAHGFAEA